MGESVKYEDTDAPNSKTPLFNAFEAETGLNRTNSDYLFPYKQLELPEKLKC